MAEARLEANSRYDMDPVGYGRIRDIMENTLEELQLNYYETHADTTHQNELYASHQNVVEPSIEPSRSNRRRRAESYLREPNEAGPSDQFFSPNTYVPEPPLYRTPSPTHMHMPSTSLSRPPTHDFMMQEGEHGEGRRVFPQPTPQVLNFSEDAIGTSTQYDFLNLLTSDRGLEHYGELPQQNVFQGNAPNDTRPPGRHPRVSRYGREIRSPSHCGTH